MSGESAIRGMVTSCKWSVWKFLHFGNLESRCGFSYNGFPCQYWRMFGLVGKLKREMTWWLEWCKVWCRCGVALLRLLCGPFFRMLSDVGIMALPAFVAFESHSSKYANCLKNRRKCLVDSDFLCIFARYLCVLRPRVRVWLSDKRVGFCDVKCE